ncbi:MAG: hypothetical protein BRD21_11225 [Halobacteriales archaeon SW_8_66_22]|jgi:hypothetical protein|nr:MAG: hypothetical protein BRD21_11225 [Halobacteriales archaeon SW_8_66_22]
MRRDHFTVAARHVSPGDAPEPTLTVEYTGPEETLTRQLTDTAGELFVADEVDAAFRLHDDRDDEDATGVFSLTHRITGGYLLEVNADADAVLSLIDAARERTEDDASYRIRIERAEAEPLIYEMDALLVYDSEGDLLRQHSLIPSGVEL